MDTVPQYIMSVAEGFGLALGVEKGIIYGPHHPG
jgi:hypothetical protein